MYRPTRRLRRKRKGNILVFSAVLMVLIMAMLALAVDLGYLYVAREQLQRSADAAALAAAWDLVDGDALSGDGSVYTLESSARSTAAQYVSLNRVLNQTPGLANEDVAFGYLSDPSNPTSTLDQSGLNTPNTVWVRVRRTSDQNGEIPFFMASVLGFDSTSAQAEATASLVNSFQGFRAPSNGNLELLPFAIDADTWDNMLAGSGSDSWRWDASAGEVVTGSDGILEVNLYPQGTGSPGNRGTVDVGSSNNSTADISRQILGGVSEGDLEHHGGKLEFDEHGELALNGDTGISAGVADELASIVGKRRIIPVFEEVESPGNNATYTITRFVGVRIMDVKLTGSQTSKKVMVQPANIISRGGIPAETSGRSDFVYSPVWLVR